MKFLRRTSTSEHDRGWYELASAWLDGELSGDERRSFEAHRTGCPLCDARVGSYRGLSGRLQSNLSGLATPSPQPIFALTRDGRHAWAPGGLRRRLALAASAAVLVAGGVSTPQVRQAVGGAVQYAGCSTGAVCAESFVGNRAYFHAPSGSVVAVAEQRLSLYSGDGANGSLTAAGKTLLPAGPVFGLAGGRVLFRAETTSGESWESALADGSDQRPFPLDAGMSVTDESSAGDRLLVRPAQDSSAAVDQAQVQVIDQSGAVVWRASDFGVSSDIQGIAPDGSFVLGVTGAGVQEISLAGGSVKAQIPLDGRLVERPEISADGSRMAFLQPADASPNAPLAVAFVQLQPQFQEPQTWPVPPGASAVFRLSPDGSGLALEGCLDQAAGSCGAGGRTNLLLWDLSNRSSRVIPGFEGNPVTALAWSADSRTLLIRDLRDGVGHLWLRGSDGRTDALAVPGSVATATFLPGGGVAALSDGGRPVGSVAIQRSGSAGDGEQVRALSDAPLLPQFARGGSVLALLQAGAPPDLVSKRGARPAQIQQSVQQIAWSPDGSRAVAISNGSAYLWSRGSGLASAPFTQARAAAWSPDGRQLVAGGDGGPALYARDGTRLRDLPSDVNADSLQWSPAALRLAGVRSEADGEQLVLVDPATGNETVLATASHIGAIAWSADGRELAYAATAAAGSAPAALRVVEADGARDSVLAQLSSDNVALAWQGSGTVVYLDGAAGGAASRPVAVPVDGGPPVVIDVAVTGLTQGPAG